MHVELCLAHQAKWYVISMQTECNSIVIYDQLDSHIEKHRAYGSPRSDSVGRLEDSLRGNYAVLERS